MNDMFRLEIDTGHGGYGFDDTFAELLDDVENEYGEEAKEEIREWALHSNEGNQYHKYGMYVTNLGN